MQNGMSKIYLNKLRDKKKFEKEQSIEKQTKGTKLSLILA
jgi:hypothetical protein